MRNLLIITLLITIGWVDKSQGQNSFESDMKQAVTNFEKATTDLEKTAVIERFEQLTVVYPDQWLPLYYATYAATLNAFQRKDAVNEADRLLKFITKLKILGGEESEILVLEAFINTVKIATDPMTFGMSLSQEIPYIYLDANELNKENPRPYYLLAQFNINASRFTGGNPKDSCPMLEKALKLFEEEDKGSVLPHWGEPQAEEIYESTCK